MVVIAIISIIAILGMVSLSNARMKSRDAKRLADVKQVQAALDMFYDNSHRYPTEEEWNTGSIVSTSSGGETIYYMTRIPESPLPADGDCSSNNNEYQYSVSADGDSYSLNFCVGSEINSLSDSMDGGGLLATTPIGLSYLGSGDVILSSQPTTFNVNYGDPLYSDSLASAYKTSDGGYILGGNNQVVSTYYLYVVKTDSSGNQLWDNHYTVSGTYPGLTVIHQTSDGGYILCGQDYDGKAVLLKVDSSWNQSWMNTYMNSLDNSFNQVRQTSDGGYIAVGHDDGSEGIYLVKTNSLGVELWSRIIEDNRPYSAYLNQESDGGYVLAGTLQGYNGGNYFLMKTDSSGLME